MNRRSTSSSSSVLVAEERFGANPYVLELLRAYRRAGRTARLSIRDLRRGLDYGVVHLQWPEALFGWRRLHSYRGREVDLIRHLEGARDCSQVVLTVHNLRPHGDSVDVALYAAILEFPTTFVHHGFASIGLLKSAYPQLADRKHIVAPHGAYRVPRWVTSGGMRSRVRGTIGISPEDLLVLNFGAQRDNKSPRFVGEVITALGTKSGVKFLSIGRSSSAPPEQEGSRAFATALRQRQDVVVSRYSPQLELNALLAASDVVLLPHSAGLTSGVLHLAISAGKWVVHPAIGNFSEQAAHWQYSRSYAPDDAQGAAQCILDVYSQLASGVRPTVDERARWTEENTWDKHVEVILQSLGV